MGFVIELCNFMTGNGVFILTYVQLTMFTQFNRSFSTIFKIEEKVSGKMIFELGNGTNASGFIICDCSEHFCFTSDYIQLIHQPSFYFGSMKTGEMVIFELMGGG